jgi:hypothetical protein
LPYLLEPEENPTFIAMIMARASQTYYDTPQVTRMDLRRMQLDLEFGVVNSDGWQAIMTAGPRLDSAINGLQEKDELFVRRAWVGKVLDGNYGYAVRAGKFFPEYGLYHYNHNIPARKGVYFNHNEEPYILQGTGFTPGFDFTLAVMKGSEESQLDGKTGGTSSLHYKYSRQRYGVSYLDMKDEKTRAQSTSFYIQAGWYKGYTLTEFDYKTITNVKGNKTISHLGYFETGYEFWKGISPYIAYEHERNVNADSLTYKPQIGVQLHLMTHTELILQAGKYYGNIAGRGEQGNFRFAMLNFYF